MLDSGIERHWGTELSQPALKILKHASSCCVAHLRGPLNDMQATGKPLVTSRHMHPTTLVHGHFGPTSGRAEAMRSRWQNRRSKAGEAVTMRLHEACCFSMMRNHVPDALEAMGQPPVDLSMSSRAPIGASPRVSRAQLTRNLLLQAKVTGRF